MFSGGWFLVAPHEVPSSSRGRQGYDKAGGSEAIAAGILAVLAHPWKCGISYLQRDGLFSRGVEQSLACQLLDSAEAFSAPDCETGLRRCTAKLLGVQQSDAAKRPTKRSRNIYGGGFRHGSGCVISLSAACTYFGVLLMHRRSTKRVPCVMWLQCVVMF